MEEQLVLRGLILQETEVGNGNKILTIFSKDYGKVAVKANGAKKATSKFLAGTQLFTYCDYVVTKKNNFYFLTSAEVIRSFYKVTEDYETLCCALSAVEIINKNTQDNFEANDELLLLINTLNALCKTKVPKLILSVFIMKYMQVVGLEPYLENCSMCQDELEVYYFGFEGLICSECGEGEDVIKVNKNIVNTLEKLFITEMNDIFKDLSTMKTHKEVAVLFKTAVWYLSQHTDIKYNSLSTLT